MSKSDDYKVTDADFAAMARKAQMETRKVVRGDAFFGAMSRAEHRRKVARKLAEKAKRNDGV